MIWRWSLALLMLAHGGIHLLGFLGPAGLSDMDGIPREATFLLDAFEVGSPVLIAFGALWLVAAIGFFAAAIGWITRSAWWRPLAAASAVISTALIVLWWTDAMVGMIPNLIVFAILIWSQRHTV